MTLREFSDKYKIPYHIVYEASYKVPVVSTLRKDREYPERPLYREVENIVNERINRHRDLLKKQEEIMDKLRSVHP